MNNINDSIAFVINVHKRLIRDFPMTPYIIWCQRVHSLSIDPLQKWEYLLSWTINPSEYSNPSLFRYDWQAFKFLSKFCPGGKPSKQDVDTAYRKFRSAEARCARVNRYLTRGNLPSGVAELLHNVKNIVSSIIGTPEDFIQWLSINGTHADINRTYDRFTPLWGRFDIVSDSLWPQFGPGISVGSSSPLKTVGEKLVLGTCTASALKWVNAMREVWPGVFPTPRLVRGSVLTFVPKRVGEARTIKFAPSMNMACQKLVGLYFKHRLKTCVGIDLSDQERNRSLAELGSLTDSYATVDLSSASDLNSIKLVCDTLPWQWFSFLDDIREKEYFDPITEKWTIAHKFSAMGNGFTFELETLIFAAIVKAATNRRSSLSWREISIYGDDLIFPKEYYADVCQALLVLGHLPNQEKSFAAGPFRESCGGDFFNGWDVTPFKIKELNINDPKTIINLYNGLYISSRENPSLTNFCPRFAHALDYVKSWLQRNFSRISEGPHEAPNYSRTMRRNIPQPSNRWLWSESPSLNCRYSEFTQKVEPAYVALEIENIPSCVINGKRQLVRYEVHSDTVLYRIRWGEQAYSWPRTTKFKRNPNLYRLKPYKGMKQVGEPPTSPTTN